VSGRVIAEAELKKANIAQMHINKKDVFLRIASPSDNIVE